VHRPHGEAMLERRIQFARWSASGDGDAMHFLTHVPQWPLCEFVELCWYADGYVAPHALERRLPTGSMQLVINLADDALRVYDQRNPKTFQTYPGLCSAARKGRIP